MTTPEKILFYTPLIIFLIAALPLLWYRQDIHPIALLATIRNVRQMLLSSLPPHERNLLWPPVPVITSVWWRHKIESTGSRAQSPDLCSVFGQIQTLQLRLSCRAKQLINLHRATSQTLAIRTIVSDPVWFPREHGSFINKALVMDPRPYLVMWSTFKDTIINYD